MATRKKRKTIGGVDTMTVGGLTVRHVLVGAGVWAASKGYIGPEDMEPLVAAGTVLAGVAWSFYQKKQ